MLTTWLLAFLCFSPPKQDPAPADLVYMKPYPIPAALDGWSGTATTSGVVVGGSPMPPSFPSVKVEARPGLHASEVVGAVRAFLTESLPGNRGTPEEIEETRRKLIHRPVFLAGDDVGFPITPCAKGLTAFMDWEIKHISVRWRIPAGVDYSMQLMCGYQGGCGEVGRGRADYHWAVHDWAGRTFMEGLEPGQYPFSVVGVRDGVPSAAASVFVDLCRFVEATDPPFVDGLHPNWERVCIGSHPPMRTSRGERPPEYIQINQFARMKNPDVPPRKFPDDDTAWMKDPEVKAGFQSIGQPVGIGAIRRRVLSWEESDAFSVSLLVRGSTGLPPVPGRCGAFVWIGDPDGLADALARGFEDFAASPDAIGLEPTGTAGETGWVEFSSGRNAPGGLLPWKPGEGELSVVVVAENLGESRIDLDWLAVRKLNCSEKVPEGYDPMGEHTIMQRLDPETGEWIRVNE